MSSMDQQITAADEAFVREAGKTLRDGADALDAHTRSRLNQARQRALDELRSKNRAQRWFADQWAPAGAVALIAVLTVAIWFNSSMETGGDPTPQQAVIVPEASIPDASAGGMTDLDVLLADESLEMIEDLEFFTWMDPGLTPEELQAELDAIG